MCDLAALTWSRTMSHTFSVMMSDAALANPSDPVAARVCSSARRFFAFLVTSASRASRRPDVPQSYIACGTSGRLEGLERHAVRLAHRLVEHRPVGDVQANVARVLLESQHVPRSPGQPHPAAGEDLGPVVERRVAADEDQLVLGLAEQHDDLVVAQREAGALLDDVIERRLFRQAERDLLQHLEFHLESSNHFIRRVNSLSFAAGDSPSMQGPPALMSEKKFSSICDHSSR